MTSKVLLYARQSVVKEGGKDSLSLDSQVAQLTARCEREGWRIIDVIREAGLKGWQDADERPGLADAISRAERHEYDILLVWDLSRLARSVRLQEHWFWQFARLGVTVMSHTEPESGDSLIRQLKGAINEYRTLELSAHQKRAILELQTRGIHHGVVPWGYQRPGRRQPLVLDPNTAPLVHEMYELRASGIGPAGIAAEFSRRGIATPRYAGSWRTATVCHMLRRIAYRGAVRAGDEIIENAHPAIVDAELWRRAQVQDTSRRHPRPKTVTSWLDGLIEHACGQAMYINQPGQSSYGAYLRCRDSGRSSRFGAVPVAPCPYTPRQVRLDRIEPLVWDAVIATLEALLDPEAIVADAQRRFRQSMPTVEAAHREAAGRKQRAVERRNRFLGLYGDGVVSRAELDVELARASAELADAERYLDRLPTLPDEAAIRERWSTLHDLASIASEIPDDRRANVLRALGVAIVAPAGVKLAGKGGADVGRVSLRLRDELIPFWARPECVP